MKSTKIKRKGQPDLEKLDKHKRSRKAHSLEDLVVNGQTTLSHLDWERRKSLSFSNEFNRKETLSEYRSVVDIGLPPQCGPAGIMFRLPRWETVNSACSSIDRLPWFDPPRRRHLDQVYASFCFKLMNALRGDGRSWATYEFFYSDLDRAW
jgi:hypothetical protein